ncbi:hypothetical protein [Actinoallomurus acaciae]|uniref:ATP-grasp domain-containing protein n=1 Tax=Actinoallomurus acaciae TaxID=502577 RepID=A0ABV5Y9X1_9ACTN
MRPTVLALTDRRDAHLPFVQRHLDDPIVVADPRTLLNGGELTYRPGSAGTVVIVDGQVLTDVAGVWFRKPLNVSPADLPVDQEVAPYSASAMREQYSQLLTEFPGAQWVSDYFAILRASNKLYQLSVADRIGLRTPPTIFTSEPKRAAEFIGAHRRVVSKPIGIVHPTVNGEKKVLFTTLLDEDRLPDLSNLHLAPSIFQVAPDVVRDLRVTVVGEKVFPADVTTSRSDGLSQVYDSRIGHYEGGMTITEAHDFPADLAGKCVRLLKELGLGFGAIDLLVDSAGEYWFLENNPNGQWAYVEQATGQPIGKAIADLLAGRP